MKHLNLLHVVLLVALMLSSAIACGRKPSQPAIAPTQAASASKPAAEKQAAQPAATEAADVTATAESAAEAESSEGEEVTFSEVSELAKFDSYRLKHEWVWKYEGGQEETAEITVEFVRDPAAQRMVMTSSDDDGKGGMEMVQIGDVTYTKFGEEWMALQSSTTDALKESGWFGSPEAFLGNTRGKLVGKETINGMATKHYRYEQQSLAPMAQLSKVDKAVADVWVSTEHNVYVQGVMHWEGTSEDKGPATFDLRSNLYDINQPITIEPPQGVEKPAAPEDVPIYAGATELAIMGQIVTFKVAASEADVIAFYQEAMPGQGWTAGDETIPQMLQFSKGDRKVTIMISAEGEGASVTIMQGE